MTQERLWIPVGAERLAAVLHLPSGPVPVPCVVASHGLAASKNSDKYLMLADSLGQVGLACCRYDFRGSGESDGSAAATTVKGRIEDLRAVITYLRALPIIDADRLGLFGSSFGGFVSHFVVKEEMVSAIVTWATPASLAGMERLKSEGVTGLGPAFFPELAERTYIEPPEGVSEILIVHGDQDDLVPVTHAKLLWERAREPKELLILHGGDHRFSDPILRQQAMDHTVEWFLKHLGH